MSAQVERIMLYVVVLVLAIAVGWLAFTVRSTAGPADECVGCEERYLAAIKAAIGDLDASVAKAMAASLSGFKQGLADDIASRVGALDDAALAKAIEDSLAGLDGRVADAVSNKLLAEGCQLTKADSECVQTATPQPPCPTPSGDSCDDSQPLIEVNSKFTFLYENARLNADRKVTANSFGVKLARRHLKRLELLTNAFGPCDRADQPVKFRVFGYSSTAEFRFRSDGEPLSNTDELNLTTANLRAQIVGDHLKKQGFQVETEQWPADHDLQRPYLDDAQPGMDQQALNRTVLIELLSAGACDLSR